MHWIYLQKKIKNFSFLMGHFFTVLVLNHETPGPGGKKRRRLKILNRVSLILVLEI